MTVEGDEALRARLRAVGNTKDLLGKVALLGVAEAKNLVPRKTSNLSRTIRVGTVTDKSAQVIAGGTSDVGYARYVEEGTGLYGPRRRKITPKAGRRGRNGRPAALAWQAGGSRVTGRGKGSSLIFRRSVKGRKATPYLVPGVKRGVARAGVDVIVSVWNKAA